MRSCGVDIASASYSGLALVVDGKPTIAMAFKPNNPKDSESVKIYEFYKWLNFKLAHLKPDIVVVEQVAGFPNRKVIQALSRFEGAALVAAKRTGAIVINPTVSRSRGIVVPKNQSKEKAWVAMKAKYPDFDFGNKTTGGFDKMDAMTHALAGPTLLERG